MEREKICEITLKLLSFVAYFSKEVFFVVVVVVGVFAMKFYQSEEFCNN